MVKAVFFDLYNTLARFWPPLEEIQQAACEEVGLGVRKEGIRRGYVLADEFFNAGNAERSLALRSPEERLEFFTEYERLVLEGAGLKVTPRLARQVWEMARSVHKELVPFEDAIPILQCLKEKGLTLGILSNLRRDMGEVCGKLGLSPYVNFCITSAEAGEEKPHPAIFKAALARAGVGPEEAVHVGDQYQADAQGALGVGITPVLIDRDGHHRNNAGCLRVSGLMELIEVLFPSQSLASGIRLSHHSST